MNRFFIFCLLLIIPLNIFGQAGKSTFDYLLLPQSARTSALGGNNVSLIETDVSLIYDNPAALGIEMDMVLNASYMSYISDINIGNVAFAKRIGESSALGIGAMFSNYGNMQETIDGNVVGDLNASDICGNVFFAHDLTSKLRGGIAAKFFYSNYHHNTAIGLGVDLGLSYYDEERKFSFGLVGKNIGRQIKSYDEELYSLPWDIQLGFSKRLPHAPIRLSLTALHLKQWEFDNYNGKKDSFFKTLTKHFIIGVDIIPSDNFWIGVGYNVKRGADMKIENGNKFGGFSAGAGLKVKAFNFAVSMGKYNISATSLMFSVSTSFAEMNL
ncbi:hypothetical protein M2138_000396 [Dysgonomonadaceae bacterium PH5-43]|nr:hypothetical protein [Dysgonomonadaceae bacterium PH5-43]